MAGSMVWFDSRDEELETKPWSGFVRERYHLRVRTGHQGLSSKEPVCLAMSGTKMSEG